ncbi:MAG: malto-oligosyltrehalose trehalohydrolase, partial [Salinimicrobium sediminis]|nr:malto-oligosyltrehalose trehalohydrolase [Salinimicrobium sediminis]
MGKKVGAVYKGEKNSQFCIWAPKAESVEVLIKDKQKPLPLTKDAKGYWSGDFTEIAPGTHYKFHIDNETFPDPASLSQPEGVHSWSQLVDHHSFDWQDAAWKGRKLSEMVIYELHVGTFTPQGTFEAIIEKLDHLEELGVNTIELMPVSQFPG